MYSVLQYFWLIGAIAPVITYYMAKKWPHSFVRYIHWPIIFAGTGALPPATVYIYLCCEPPPPLLVPFLSLGPSMLTPYLRVAGGVVGIFFNWYIKRRFGGWWGRYNYITSAALDCGLYICTLLIFFALILPQKVNPPQWFMNPPADGNPNVTNAFNNLDSNGAAIELTVAPGETFGPSSW